MVVSFLTIYAIAFSCFTLLVGKSFAAASIQVLDHSARQGSDRRAAKINFQEKGSGKSTRSPKVHQSSYLPSNSIRAKPFSNESIRALNESHSYFALFGPPNSVTVKLHHSGNPLFSDNYIRSANDDKTVMQQQKHPQHPWNVEKIKNFVAWDTLEDSEKEMRAHYKGVTAKETIITTGVNVETMKKQGLKLRQLTDGRRFIQLIYTLDDVVQDCEFLRERNVVQKFLNTFREDIEKVQRTAEIIREERKKDDEYLEEDEGSIERYLARENRVVETDVDDVDDEDETYGTGYRNVTFQIIRRKGDLPRELREWMNYSVLKKKCLENHRILKKVAYESRHGEGSAKRLAEERIERAKRSINLSLVFPGTKWCGKGSTAGSYTELGSSFATDKCCRTHDHCDPLIKAFQTDYGYFNVRPFTISHCSCDRRRKRDIMDVLLVPGTKWCGKGRRATKYTSLGGFSRTDKCCRVHDTMCPHWIGSMQEKYGLFNWRINTIMHCRCDKRFRACLKMAKTGTANFVGKLFFNVVQTKCFVLKPKEVCIKYSWWGKCEKKEYRKQAHLKDNLSY